MGDKIFVDSFTGGSDGDDLIECYFKQKNDGTYDFHDKDDHTKCTNLSVGSSCSFTLDEYPGVTWTITLTSPCTATEVNGNWSNTDGGFKEDAESGTFTAQAGGGAGEGGDEDVADEPERILPLEQIQIVAVWLEDGTKIDNALMNCFFSPQGPAGEYVLFEDDGKEKRSGIRGDEYFEFRMADQLWVLRVQFHAQEMRAHGHWHSFGPDDAEEGGTFTAQAGGGMDTETAASAYA